MSRLNNSVAGHPRTAQSLASFLILLLVLTLVNTVFSASSGNLVTNGTFETGSVSPWSMSTSGTGNIATLTITSDAFNGNYAGKISVTSCNSPYPNGYIAFNSPMLTPATGKTYTLTFTYKASSWFEAFFLSQTSTAQVYNKRAVCSASSTWKTFSFEVGPLPTAPQNWFTLRFNSLNTVTIDDISLSLTSAIDTTPTSTSTPTPTVAPTPTPTPTSAPTPAAASSYVFEDGFESGGFGVWSGTSTSSGESATVATSFAYQGTRSAAFSSNGGGGYERSYAYRSLTSYKSELYTRGYFRVSRSGIAQNSDRFIFMRVRSGSNDLAYAGWRMVNGVLRWSLTVRSGTSYATAYSTSAPSLNVWYCVELHWKGASSGLGELWVNGVKVASVSNVNTAALGNANLVRFGLAEVYACAATSINADNFVISTKYVGQQQITTPTSAPTSTPVPTPASTPTAMPTPTSTPTPNPAPLPTPTPTPAVGVKVAVFSDSACTKSLSSIDWGVVSRGVSVTRVVYLKNVGSSQVTLSLMKTNWNPIAANGPVTVNWNREGSTLAANQVLSATLTLSVSPSVTGFTTFSVDAVITGTG